MRQEHWKNPVTPIDYKNFPCGAAESYQHEVKNLAWGNLRDKSLGMIKRKDVTGGVMWP